MNDVSVEIYVDRLPCLVASALCVRGKVQFLHRGPERSGVWVELYAGFPVGGGVEKKLSI